MVTPLPKLREIDPVFSLKQDCLLTLRNLFAYKIQKLSPEGFYKKGCSKKCCKIERKTSVQESLFY